jgi:hypothetical protein
MERYSAVVLPWSGEQSICYGLEEKCRQMKERPRKARLLLSLHVVVGVTPHALKFLKIR